MELVVTAVLLFLPTKVRPVTNPNQQNGRVTVTK
jgi:hypothetical protein